MENKVKDILANCISQAEELSKDMKATFQSEDEKQNARNQQTFMLCVETINKLAPIDMQVQAYQENQQFKKQ